jgi:hypothetical protein
MIGTSQGEAEISLDLAEGFSRRKAIKSSGPSSIFWQDQRMSSVARHPFAGTAPYRRCPRRLS